MQPLARKLGARRGGRPRFRAAGQPVVHRRPAVLAADPGAARPAADDAAVRAEYGQHPGGYVDHRGVRLAVGHLQLGAQPRLVLREFGRGGLAAGGERPDGRVAHLDEPPGGVVGDAGLRKVLDQQPPLLRRDCVGAGRLDHRYRRPGYHEHGPPHAQHP